MQFFGSAMVELQYNRRVLIASFASLLLGPISVGHGQQLERSSLKLGIANKAHLYYLPVTIADYMHPGATAFFHALPPMITAFRGCGRGHVLGISWSMDRKIAKQFADPVLATARIRRDAVLAVCIGRLEFEIIVDPKYLRGIQLEAIKPHH